MGTPFAGRNRSELEIDDRVLHQSARAARRRVGRSVVPRAPAARTRQTTLERIRARRRPVRDGRASDDTPARPEPDARLPGDDGPAQPGLGAVSAEVRAPRHDSATEIVHEKGWAKFDLLLGMSQRQNGLNTTWEYSTELFDDATVKRIACHFEKLLESDRRRPDRPISRLPMLLEEERQVILSAGPRPRPSSRRTCWSRTVRSVGKARRPRRTPSCSTERDVRTASSNERANRLAHRLRDLGVGPGRLVGIYMEKSLDLVTPCSPSSRPGGICPARSDVSRRPHRVHARGARRPVVIVTEAGLAPPIDALDEDRVVLRMGRARPRVGETRFRLWRRPMTSPT